TELLEKSVLWDQLPVLYRCAWEIRPKRVWWMSWLTFSNFLNGNLPGLDHYLQWLRVSPSLKDQYAKMLFFNIGDLYRVKERYATATEFYLEAIERGDQFAYNSLALC